MSCNASVTKAVTRGSKKGKKNPDFRDKDCIGLSAVSFKKLLCRSSFFTIQRDVGQVAKLMTVCIGESQCRKDSLVSANLETVC